MDEEIILSLEAGLTKNIIVYVEAGLMGNNVLKPTLDQCRPKLSCYINRPTTTTNVRR